MQPEYSPEAVKNRSITHQFTFHLAPPTKLRDNKYNVPGMGKFVYTAAAFSNRNQLKRVRGN